MVISNKKPKVKMARKNLKRNLFIASLLFVPLLHFLVFWLYINLETISLAFMEWDFFSNSYKFAGIDNFIEQFRQFKARPETMNMFKNAFRAIPINLANHYWLCIFKTYSRRTSISYDFLFAFNDINCYSNTLLSIYVYI